MSERVLEPLEMSDTEILDWLNEYSYKLDEFDGRWSVYAEHDYNRVWYGANIRDAVRSAAAFFKEANRDF